MHKSSRGDIVLPDRREYIISVAITASLFFIMGFVSWLNAILIPYFRIACELTNFQSYLVTFAFYIAYLLISVPASWLLRKTGFKKGIMFGCWAMSVGAWIFIPAAMERTFGLFLVGLFTIGAGLAVLQTGANTYITLLGSKESAARRISIMGICNKGAGIIAPILFAAVVLKATDTSLFKELPHMDPAAKSVALDALIRRVIVPYLSMGAMLFLFGLLINRSPLPEINTELESQETASVNADKKSIFQFPHLILGALAIFLHVGTQVIAIDTIIGYANSMQLNLIEAKAFPSYTLFATICGYVIGIIMIPKWISQLNALRICTLLGMIFTLVILFSYGSVFFLGHHADISIWFLCLLGLANSLVWAALWPLALNGLGRFTKLGASIMIMGLCGNAILPLVYGWLADRFGARDGYWILFPCYLYLVFYAFHGYRIKRWSV